MQPVPVQLFTIIELANPLQHLQITTWVREYQVMVIGRHTPSPNWKRVRACLRRGSSRVVHLLQPLVFMCIFLESRGFYRPDICT
jgi:hypothetical protein